MNSQSKELRSIRITLPCVLATMLLGFALSSETVRRTDLGDLIAVCFVITGLFMLLYLMVSLIAHTMRQLQKIAAEQEQRPSEKPD